MLTNIKEKAGHINQSVLNHLPTVGYTALPFSTWFLLDQESHDLSKFILMAQFEVEIFKSGDIYLYFIPSSTIELNSDNIQ